MKHTRKRMENIGRQCVRCLQEEDGSYALVRGPLPRNGFPKGSRIREGERLYDAAKLLASVQQWMKDTEQENGNVD